MILNIVKLSRDENKTISSADLQDMGEVVMILYYAMLDVEVGSSIDESPLRCRIDEKMELSDCHTDFLLKLCIKTKHKRTPTYNHNTYNMNIIRNIARVGPCFFFNFNRIAARLERRRYQ